jgi:hypothetical protein
MLSDVSHMADGQVADRQSTTMYPS